MNNTIISILKVEPTTTPVGPTCSIMTSGNTIPSTNQQFSLTATSNNSITCYFSANFSDGTQLTTNNETISGSMTLHLTHIFSDEGIFLVSTTVWCNNAACNITKVMNITVGNIITGFSVTHPILAAANEVVSFNLFVVTGSGLMYLLDYGDGTVDLTAENQWISFNETVTFSHIFTNQTQYSLQAVVSNSISQVNLTFAITVFARISDLSFYGSSSVMVPLGTGRWGIGLGRNLNTIFGLNCTWTIGILKSTITNHFLPQLTATNPFEVTYNYSLSECDGMPDQVTVNCSNAISWQYYAMNVTVGCVQVNISTTYKMTSVQPVTDISTTQMLNTYNLTVQPVTDISTTKRLNTYNIITTMSNQVKSGIATTPTGNTIISMRNICSFMHLAF